MSKLPTRFVIAILAIGVLVGAATTTTVINGGLKPSNLAQAQIPVQQAVAPAAVSSAAPPSSAGPPFGPNCVGCISTQNLANGAVTTPKIAPGAASLTTQIVQSQLVTVFPGDVVTQTSVACPSGSILTGGGYRSGASPGTGIVFINGPVNEDGVPTPGQWNVFAVNTGAPGANFGLQAIADCTAIHP